MQTNNITLHSIRIIRLHNNGRRKLSPIAVFKWTSVAKPLAAISQQQARALSRTASLASQQVDYYAVMFVPKTAKQREIREAYNTLAKVYDPKKHKDNAQKLQLVQEAYAVLSNVSLRRLFDQGKCGAGPYKCLLFRSILQIWP